MRIVVSHPHAAAVANAVAHALDERGFLAVYATGVAAAPAGWRRRFLGAAAWILPELHNRAIRVGEGRLRARWSVELMARLAAKAGAIPGQRPVYDAVFWAHDAAVAVLPWPIGVDAVYAYEDGALRTFRRARARGIPRVWDLPIPHWATLDRMWRDEAARWPLAVASASLVEPEWKRRRKDGELELADVVSVASHFTRASLEAASCKKPVVVTAYGFPVGSFAEKVRPQDGPFSVLAVGTQDLRKGTPYLLEAWRRAKLRDARLRIVGPICLSRQFLAAYQNTFEHEAHLPRAELQAEYQAADLLVFPTLGDGFGLVMQEAMSCGTPVLTTPCGGGPECIDDGVEGWVVPPRDIDALVERLRWGAEHRDRLAQMGRAARRRAESYDERAAGEQLVAGLERALGAVRADARAPRQRTPPSTSS